MNGEMEAMSTPEERRDRIQRALGDIAQVVAEAYRLRDWEHFGYGTWAEYVAAEFGALRLPRAERKAAVLELRAEGLSQPAIAEVVGASQQTVSNDLAEMQGDLQGDTEEEPGSELTKIGRLPERIVGLDGKERPAQVPHVARNSGENEWYTPPAILEAARAVLGSIDLDPASSDIANQTVQAVNYFTKDNDGLAQPWKGRVWMNPPYASELIGKFCGKLCDSYAVGDVSEAIVLVNNGTETSWFLRLVEHAAAICFPTTRVRFIDPAGNPSGAPLQGQAILYLGHDTEAFFDSFYEVGWLASVERYAR